MTPIIGGPSAGDITDAVATTIRLCNPATTAAHPCAVAHETTFYTRRLFSVTDFNGERVVMSYYAPEDWSDERVFNELLLTYRKAHQ